MDVTATYQDGILEVTVQLPKESDHTSGKIPVSRGHKTTTNGHPVAGANDAPSPAPAPE